MFKSQKGFTLLELMVVIGILAIMMLAAVPAYLGHQQDTEVNNVMRDTKTLEDAAMGEFVKPSTDGWEDGIVSTDDATWDFEVDGDPVDLTDFDGDLDDAELYEIEEDVLTDNVQRIYGDLSDYAIFGSEADNSGEVISLDPVEDSEGVFHIHPSYTYEDDGEE